MIKKKRKKYTLEQLQSLVLWHIRRTPAISTDDSSLYRALVDCWSYSAGLTKGESLDIELAMVVEKIMTR